MAWGQDLQSEHERYLTEKHVGRPVVVTDYPKDIKAFYMRLNDDERTVAAMDVLVPGIGEIIGGSQREERLAILDARLNNDTLKEHLWWYRDLRRYGTVPHAGFGLGFERLLMYPRGWKISGTPFLPRSEQRAVLRWVSRRLRRLLPWPATAAGLAIAFWPLAPGFSKPASQ